MQWTIGDVRVTRLLESEVPTRATFLIPAATQEALAGHAEWLRPHFMDERGRIVAAVHALIVESQGRRIVVDTCVGNDKERTIPAWNRLQGPFLQHFTDAGFAREEIDTVVCTHLHVDHVGWNTMLVDGRWLPTFPNARYLFVRAEWEHWNAAGPMVEGDVVGDSVRPVVDAGLVDLVAPDHRLTDEVWLESTPGHTPGHVSVRIRSAGVDAVITGDVMHHPVQCAEPAWHSSFDVDADAARVTRRAFLERYADRPVLVLGTHFATPVGGRIVRYGDAWRFLV